MGGHVPWEEDLGAQVLGTGAKPQREHTWESHARLASAVTESTHPSVSLVPRTTGGHVFTLAFVQAFVNSYMSSPICPIIHHLTILDLANPPSFHLSLLLLFH